MRAISLALSIFLLGTGPVVSGHARAATKEGNLANPIPVSSHAPFRAIQLAGSFNKSPNKLNDKYQVGKSGGRTGIGSTESVVFKKKVKPVTYNKKDK